MFFLLAMLKVDENHEIVGHIYLFLKEQLEILAMSPPAGIHHGTIIGSPAISLKNEIQRSIQQRLPALRQYRASISKPLALKRWKVIMDGESVSPLREYRLHF